MPNRGGERTQIGPAIDAELWERFRQNVEARKGTVRGNLGTELENAIRQYIGDLEADVSPGDIQRIDNRLSRIEQSLGAADTDGGCTLSTATDTHTPPSKPPSKPSAKASTEEKVAYLAACVLDREVPNSRTLESVSDTVLREVVGEEYSFRDDTVERYVERLIDHFGLVEHPDTTTVYMTPAKREALLADRRSTAANEADDELDRIESAEVNDDD